MELAASSFTWITQVMRPSRSWRDIWQRRAAKTGPARRTRVKRSSPEAFNRSTVRVLTLSRSATASSAQVRRVERGQRVDRHDAVENHGCLHLSIMKEVGVEMVDYIGP